MQVFSRQIERPNIHKKDDIDSRIVAENTVKKFRREVPGEKLRPTKQSYPTKIIRNARFLRDGNRHALSGYQEHKTKRIFLKFTIL